MATSKITQIAEPASLGSAAHILITHQESSVETLRRATMDQLIQALGIAAPYAQQTYSKCAICTHNGQLYMAKQDIDTAEAFTASHWTAIYLADILTYLAQRAVSYDSDNHVLIFGGMEPQ